MTDTLGTFQCPSCGASLEPPTGTATMKCGYCGTSVVIPEAIRSVPRPADAPAVIDFNTVIAKAIHMGEVVKLVRAGDRDGAIRLYQENSSATAEQAAQVIQAIVDSAPAEAAVMNEAGFGALGSAVASMASAAEERELARQQRRRARRGCGLVLLIVIGFLVYYLLSTIGLLPSVLIYLHTLIGK
jgi:hypothetical protein